MSIQKEFNFDINTDSIIKEEFSFIKGDSVKLTFAFKKADGSDFDDSEATKMRVQAWTKGFSTKSYAFGAEFEKTADEEWVATFSSSNTVGYAGTLDITVQLIGETDSAIIGAMLIANVIESNSSVSFEASESFRDEIESLALQAIEDAATATAAAAEAETAKTGAVEAKTAAEQALADTQAIKTEVTTLKTETSAIKTAAETSLNNIVNTATTSLNAIKTDTEAIKTATTEIKTAAETSLNGIVADAESDLNEIKTDTEALKNAALTAADSATQVVGLQNLSQIASKQGKFYLNAGAMYASVDLLGTYFESFSICATIDSSYTGTIFSYGDTSSYLMAKVSSSSIVISSSANGDLISYDCSDLTSENRALVFASDGTTLTLYINGLVAATATLNSDVPSGDNTLIFGSYANTSYFPYAYGQMWNIKVFGFDMGAGDYVDTYDIGTPYTLAQYTKGENCNPRLKSTHIASLDPDFGYSNGVVFNYCTDTSFGEYNNSWAEVDGASYSTWNKAPHTIFAKTITDQDIIQDETISSALAICSTYGMAETGTVGIYQNLGVLPRFLRVSFKYKSYQVDESYSYASLYLGVQDNSTNYKRINFRNYNLGNWFTYEAIWDFKDAPTVTSTNFQICSNRNPTLIVDLKIETLDEVLEPMDYTTQRNSTTRVIKDCSLNKNDLSLLGNIQGTLDGYKDAEREELTTIISQSS